MSSHQSTPTRCNALWTLVVVLVGVAIAIVSVQADNHGYQPRAKGCDFEEGPGAFDDHDECNRTLKEHASRLGGHDQKLQAHESLLEGHDKKLSQHDSRLNNIETTLNRHETRLNRLEDSYNDFQRQLQQLNRELQELKRTRCHCPLRFHAAQARFEVPSGTPASEYANVGEALFLWKSNKRRSARATVHCDGVFCSLLWGGHLLPPAIGGHVAAFVQLDGQLVQDAGQNVATGGNWVPFSGSALCTQGDHTLTLEFYSLEPSQNILGENDSRFAYAAHALTLSVQVLQEFNL